MYFPPWKSTPFSQTLQAIILLIHLHHSNAAQNISGSLLGWSSNPETLKSCLRSFTNTTSLVPAGSNYASQTSPYYHRREHNEFPFTQLLAPRKTGLDFTPYAYFVNSDNSLCSICNEQSAAFTPTRLLSSYTPGWPEILLGMISAGIAIFTADRYPLKPFSIIYASISATCHLAADGWAMWHFAVDPGSAPWLTGDGWVILLVSFFKIQAAMKRLEERDMYGVRKKGRAQLILLCYFGMGASVLIGFATLVVVMLGIFKTDLHLWEKAYDVHSSVPAVCGGMQVNGYMPSTYHAMALRFLTAEVAFSWLMFLFLAIYYGYARSGGDMFKERSFGLYLLPACLIGWFLILKPIELVKTIQHGKLGNVVQRAGDCCIVLPTQLWGGMVDMTGTLLGVIGRFISLL
jgi:hypothetical protein